MTRAHEAQVGFLAWKLLDEVLARHLRLVDREMHDRALVGAHFVDQLAHADWAMFQNPNDLALNLVAVLPLGR